jgi:hypothetical protein
MTMDCNLISSLREQTVKEEERVALNAPSMYVLL